MFPLESFEKLIVGMSLEDGIGAVRLVGLSVLSLTNLSGIMVGLVFLSSWTSSMCPTLTEEIGIGAMEAEESGANN